MESQGPFSKNDTVRVGDSDLVYRVKRLDESGQYILTDESGTELPGKYPESSLKRVQILKG